MKLGDGSVIPSNLGMKPLGNARSMIYSNVSLKNGMVIAQYYPDQPGNVSGKSIEYDVAVIDADVTNGVNLRTFRNCRVNNVFGAPHNSLEYTLTPAVPDGDGTYSKGSMVLVLCINGIADATSAIIIGGTDNPEGKIYSSSDGQFYDFNFNGINYNIDQNGEWTVTFNSPPDSSGNPTNSAASGTQIKIDQQGRVKISDNAGQSWQIDRVAKNSTWTNGSETITIDQNAKSISVKSGGDINETAQGGWNAMAQKDANVQASSNANVMAGSNMMLQSGSNMTQQVGASWMVNVSGSAQVMAQMLMLQGQTMAQLKGLLTLIGMGTLPIAAVGLSQTLTMLGPIPLPGTIITGSSTCFVGP